MGNLKRIKIGLTVLALNVLTPVFTQAQELEVGVLGGLTGLKDGEVKISDGTNFGFSLMYLQSLDDNWKIGLGGEFGVYKLSKELLNHKDSYEAIDSEGESFDFRYNFLRLEEELKGNYLGIPVKVRFESRDLGNSNWKLYASAGIKYQIYLNAKSKIRLDNLNTSGYYEQFDAELHNPESAGFGSFENREADISFKLKDGFFVLGEFGVRYRFTNRQSLYMGVFADYDFANSSDAPAGTLINYKAYNRDHLEINSVLRKGEEKQSIRLFTVGLKLKYNISF